MFGFKKSRPALIQQYQQLCLRHGNTATQIRRLAHEQRETERQIDSINKQFEKISAAERKANERKAAAAPAPAPQAPSEPTKAAK